MRNLFTSLALSLVLLMSGSSVAYAGGRHDNGRAHNEQKQNGHRGNGNINKNKGNKHPGGKPGNGHVTPGKPGGKPGNGHVTPGKPGGNSVPRPGGYGKPTPPPPPHSYGRPGHHYRPPRVAPANHYYPDRLGFMIRQATVGARNIAVWEVEPGTYMLRYTRGGVEYLRYIYPNLNRYGSIQILTPGWQPYSSWLSVPAIQLNLWL